MLVYDNITINASNRKVDKNGFLKVKSCNITKEQVAPYYGSEIPNWREFGLDSKTIYYVYRPEAELAKAADTFNNLPLTRDHIEVAIDDVPKERIVGSLGDRAEYKAPYLTNSLMVYDKTDIDNILNGNKKELSCGYRYTPVKKSGEWHGQHYDFVMTDIVGNHVALVKEGRAGHDVVVADSKPIFEEKGNTMTDIKEDKIIESENPITNDKAIPDEQDKPETAGEEKAEQEESKMTDENKEALAEDKCAKDEKDIEGKEKKAFAEGVDYGEEKEKSEPKKLDSEHESEGTKKADEKKKEEKEAEDKCTKDSALTMDIDTIKAQVREEVIADFKAREEARKSVESIVGEINVMAFDSCSDIYKLACEKEGLPVNEIVSYKDALTGYLAGKSKLTMDASPVSGSNEECFKDIRV